jgi:hypothetical protein
MFAKRCQSCQNVFYTKSLREVAPPCEKCGGTAFIDLAKICCFIPLREGGNHLHTSDDIPLGFPPDVSGASGVQWQTACNSKVHPVNGTNQPLACTCYECVKYLKDNNLMDPKPVEVDEPSNTEIVFEGDTPPNPFAP